MKQNVKTRTIAKAREAFTLLEVLVSSAILSILLVILLGTVSGSLNVWRATEDKVMADREGRAAYALMAQDLGNAYVPADSNLWPRVTNAAATSSLRFLTLRPPDYQDAGAGDFGDLCYVEYVVRRTNTLATIGRRSNNIILRKFVGSRDTFAALQNPSTAFNTLSANAAPYQELAYNVVPNQVALKSMPVVARDGTAGAQAISNNFRALRITNASGKLVYVTNPANLRPEAIEVSIGTVDSDALRTNNAMLLTNAKIPHRGSGMYTFTVDLPAAPAP